MLGCIAIAVAVALRRSRNLRYWGACLAIVGVWFALMNILNGAPIVSTPALLGGAPALGVFSLVRLPGFRHAGVTVSVLVGVGGYVAGQLLAVYASIFILDP